MVSQEVADVAPERSKQSVSNVPFPFTKVNNKFMMINDSCRKLS